MSGIYIHKASNKYVILSLALLLYTLYFFFSLLMHAFPVSKSSISQEVTYLVKLDSDWQVEGITEFVEKLKKAGLSSKLKSWEIRDKDIAWDKIQKESGVKLFENPLHHYIILNFTSALDTGETNAIKSGIAEIRSIETVSDINSGKTNNQRFKKIQFILIPLIIFALILFVSILNGAVDSNLNSNKRVLESLLIAGAHHSKLSALFRKNALINFTGALLLAIVLYLVTVYLIKSGLKLENGDFANGVIIKSIGIPSLVVFGLHSIILLWKVDKYLKSF